MGKVKNWTVEKKDEIESILINLWASIGMGIPENFEVIVQDCYEDICETADPIHWHSGDVAIAFRRWIEAQTQRKVDAMYEAEQRIIDLNVAATIREKAVIKAFNAQQANVQVENVQEPKPYFEIMKQGWDEELQREEIQIHGGENANIFLIKTEEGFVIDVYGQNGDDPLSLQVWEDDLCDEGDDMTFQG